MLAQPTIEKMQCQNCFAQLNMMGKWSHMIACDYCGTEHMLSESVQQIKAKDSHRFAVNLVRMLAKDFADEELEHLIFELNHDLPRQCSIVHPDDIGGRTRLAKARNLVTWCKRRTYLQYLVNTILRLRPLSVYRLTSL